jgi:hypothetical protein
VSRLSRCRQHLLPIALVSWLVVGAVLLCESHTRVAPRPADGHVLKDAGRSFGDATLEKRSELTLSRRFDLAPTSFATRYARSKRLLENALACCFCQFPLLATRFTLSMAGPRRVPVGIDRLYALMSLRR